MFLSKEGLAYLWLKIKIALSAKADAEHSHAVATVTANGMMSAGDKAKLIALEQRIETLESALEEKQGKIVNWDDLAGNP